MEISDLVSRVRRALGLTQAELGRALSMTTQTVNRWEAGDMDPREDVQRAFGQLESQLSVLERVQAELETVGRLNTAMLDEIKRLAKSSIEDQLAERRAFARVHDPLSSSVTDYERLRRQGYGRLVVARDAETNDVRLFRVAYGPVYWTPLFIYNRNAPAVAKVMSAAKGDIVTLRRGGIDREYEILEVSLLFRHADLELTGNEDNFRQLEFDILPPGTSTAHVDELRQWLANARKIMLDALVAGVEPELATAPEEAPPLDMSSRAALSERFFMQPLADQEEAMRWQPEGHVLVEGIAGSGKTSVAFGRTAMLCMERDSNGGPGRYRAETGIGFVLNDQLVRYLADLRGGVLNLEKMPIRSYTSLRNELIVARGLVKGFVKRDPSPEVPGDRRVLGSIVYLQTVERFMPRGIAEALLSGLAATARESGDIPLVGDAQWEPLEPIWARLREGLRSAITAGAGMGGLVARVDSVRAQFAEALEHEGRWEAPRLVDARRRVRDRVRDAVARACDFGHRYFDVLDMPEFEGELGRALPLPEADIRDAFGRARLRRSQSRLSVDDMDCLLLLAHHAAQGYRGRDGAQPIGQLAERPYYTHVFIDEVQDFTEVQVRLMAEHADPRYRAVTAVGDFAQRLAEGGLSVTVTGALDVGPGRRIFLNRNKRQSSLLHALAADFRGEIQGDVRACIGDDPTPTDERPFLFAATAEETVAGLRAALVDTRDRFPQYSMAVLCPDGERARELEHELHDEMWAGNVLTRVSDREEATAITDIFHVHFTTPLQVKGLEFDAVFVVDADTYNLESEMEQAALYVALSRARQRLGVAYRARPAGALGGLLDRHLGQPQAPTA